MVDDKYLEWLTNALSKLDNDLKLGFFKPRNESDMKSYLYHLLIQSKPEESMDITTEYNFKKKYLVRLI